MNQACYDNIIGLSRTECSCFDTGKPEGFNTSNSGLYLDELQPLNQVADLTDCSNTDVWTVLSRAREQAINTFIADSSALMLRYYNASRQAWQGQIGESVGRDTLTIATTYAGVRIKCASIKSGKLKIRNIRTLFANTGTVTLTIYDNLNRTVCDPISLDTTANALKANAQTSLELPLQQSDNPETEYFLVFEVGSNQVKNNKISCGCGSWKAKWSSENPYYLTGNAAPSSYGWGNWIMVSGWKGDTLTDFDNVTTGATQYMNGLALDISVYCDVTEVLCRDSIAFTGEDPLALSIAYAIWYKAGEFTIGRLLNTTILTRANVINRDLLPDLAQEWQAKYNEHIHYIVQNAPIQHTGCLACKPKMQTKAVLV